MWKTLADMLEGRLAVVWHCGFEEGRGRDTHIRSLQHCMFCLPLWGRYIGVRQLCLCCRGSVEIKKQTRTVVRMYVYLKTVENKK